MASTVTPTQVRINDPYQQTVFAFNTPDSKLYLSRESNKLLNVVGSDIIIKDLTVTDPTIVSPSTVRAIVSTGWAIQDETLLNIASFSTVDLDCSALVDTLVGGAHLGIFINYQYFQTVEENNLSIDMFHIQSDGTVTDPTGRFSLNSCRILLDIINFTKSGSNVVAVSKNLSNTITISGTTYYRRNLNPTDLVLPNLYSLAFAEYREYLLKQDYLLME
ncbi:MAG: hypothetical protein WC188_04645 [Candidatus Caldatribacteriota bacterium]|nr:hypothetical protein [Patescibacteria group bacterium]